MKTKSALLSVLISSMILSSPLCYAKSATKKTRDIVLSEQVAEVPLNVNIHTSKNTYKVDEAIFLQADSPQDFYLYVFNTGRDGNTTMLVPNAKYTNNLFKANTIHNIPDNVGPAMVGDQAGKESLIIVASATPLTFETGFASKGVYRQAKTKEVKKMFRSKDIKWVERVSEYAPTNNVVANSESPSSTITENNSMTMAVASSNTSNVSTDSTTVMASNNTEQTTVTTTTTTTSGNSDTMLATNNTDTTTTTSIEPSNGHGVESSSSTGSMISAPNPSDNKQIVSYLLEVEIVN